MIKYINQTIVVIFMSWLLALLYFYLFGEMVANKNLLEEYLVFFVPLHLFITAEGIHSWLKKK
tara:strand:- start:388 stop:576 length:189 start_codon:yes stop_codon:yes gene_type:complete